MDIFVNGELSQVAADLTLAGLVAGMQLHGQRLAIELNGDIVPRSQWDVTALRAGDRAEIVRAIGGG
jgi:thiamine biosynthesis protein ThiS